MNEYGYVRRVLITVPRSQDSRLLSATLAAAANSFLQTFFFQHGMFTVRTCAILPVALVSFQRCLAEPGFTARMRGASMLERVVTLVRHPDMSCRHLETTLLDQALEFDLLPCNLRSDV